MEQDSVRHGGEVFSYPESERDSFIDFSININPLGMSPKGKLALLQGLDRDILRYPDTKARDLRTALSERYQVDEQQITLGNGATELMYTLLQLLRPKRVIIPEPAFGEYRLSAMAAGCEIKSIPLSDRDFSLPVDAILDLVAADSLIYLGNPNNPDGHLLPENDLNKILKTVEEKHGYVVVDESFIDFGHGKSYRYLCSTHSSLIVVMSLTKFYACPGLRAGCAFSSPALASALAGRLVPWHINGPAQTYMTAALSDTDYIRQSVSYCAEQKRKLCDGLSKYEELHHFKGYANYVLCRLDPEAGTVPELEEQLRSHHILIRNCSNYTYLNEYWFRVAVRTDSENNLLVSALRKALST